MGTTSSREVRSKLGKKEETGLQAEVLVTRKTELLRAWCDLGMKRSRLWVEPRAGLCIQGRSVRWGWKGRKEESCDVWYLRQ